MYPPSQIHGAGLGLRRAHLGPLSSAIPDGLNFLEIAPENWLHAGGRLGDALAHIAARTPLVCHGLLLNLGGPDPLDVAYVRQIKKFLDHYNVKIYGDHLTFCGAAGLLYELLPMPFTAEAVGHLATRIRQVQDILERTIAVENASYYCVPMQDMSEIDFITGVLEQADCALLLDINNVYVNSVNHAYDPREFLARIPASRIAYAHIAGHLRDADLIIDTHGAAVIDPVWALLEHAYAEFGVFPTLLERDENIPPLATVMREVAHIAELQAKHSTQLAPPSRHSARRPAVKGEDSRLIAAQRTFAAYLRDPEHLSIPFDLAPERIAVYRHAVYANIERFMGDNFPRVKACLEDARWHLMIRDYVRHHRAETPAFAHLPNEFLRYLAATELAACPPYLGELAHFEWLENCLSIDQRRVDLTAIDRTGDLLTGQIVVNPIHRVESYRYPVHVTEAGFEINESIEPTHLVAFRDLANEFQFLELNTLALRLFCAIRDTPEINAAQVLREISEALGRHDPNPVLAGGLDILERLHKRQLILGTRAN